MSGVMLGGLFFRCCEGGGNYGDCTTDSLDHVEGGKFFYFSFFFYFQILILRTFPQPTIFPAMLTKGWKIKTRESRFFFKVISVFVRAFVSIAKVTELLRRKILWKILCSPVSYNSGIVDSGGGGEGWEIIDIFTDRQHKKNISRLFMLFHFLPFPFFSFFLKVQVGGRGGLAGRNIEHNLYTTYIHLLCFSVCFPFI